MAAAALAIRLPARTRPREGAAAEVCGLSFDQPGGPIVAVCGLMGGAGTTTLAWLLARQAARESVAPTLLCESEALAGGLAVLAGAASRTGLGDLARDLAQGIDLQAAPFAQIPGGPRLIATVPRLGPPRLSGALERVLGMPATRMAWSCATRAPSTTSTRRRSSPPPPTSCG